MQCSKYSILGKGLGTHNICLGNSYLKALLWYCKFRKFSREFYFRECIKRHIYDIKNSQLRLDLPTTTNNRVILLIREGFIFTKFREDKTLAKISEFTVSTATVYPCLLLVQSRKTSPYITERLLMGRKESNQSNKQKKQLQY